MNIKTRIASLEAEAAPSTGVVGFVTRSAADLSRTRKQIARMRGSGRIVYHANMAARLIGDGLQSTIEQAPEFDRASEEQA